MEGSSPQAWGTKGPFGAFLLNFRTAKMGFGARRSWWCPTPHSCGIPLCWASLGPGGGLSGAAAPSCLGDLEVLRGPLCPKATLSHGVCFAWALPMQNCGASPAWQTPPGQVALARVALAGVALTRAAVPGDPAKGRGDEHSPLPPQPRAKLVSCTHGHPNMLLRPLSRGFWDTGAASHAWCQLGPPARHAECSLRWAWGR